MILPFIGLAVGLFLLILGTYFIRSKHANKTPLSGHGDGVDHVDSFLLSLLLSIGVILFSSLSVRQYGYFCLAGGILLLYGINEVW